jgi:hypothetical protein
VDVELVEAAWIVAIVCELNLELQLVFSHRSFADRADGPDARTAPGAVRATGRELTILDCGAGFLSKNRLVGHRLDSAHVCGVEDGGDTSCSEEECRSQMPQERAPGCANQ